MAKENTVISEDFVKNSIIKWLSCNGWGYFKFDKLHTHGVDIRARAIKYSRFFYIETKGQGKLRQSSEVSFIYSLGQIITRMKDDKSTINYYALGLPEKSAKIALRRLPWQVAKKLHLSILSVDDNGEVIEYKWKELQSTNKD